MTSTLLKYLVAPKLESILDKESKITHDMLAAQIESRLGSGEGSTAKGPDMKVWSKGKGLEKVSFIPVFENLAVESQIGGLALCRILLPAHHHLQILQIWL